MVWLYHKTSVQASFVPLTLQGLLPAAWQAFSRRQHGHPHLRPHSGLQESLPQSVLYRTESRRFTHPTQVTAQHSGRGPARLPQHVASSQQPTGTCVGCRWWWRSRWRQRAPLGSKLAGQPSLSACGTGAACASLHERGSSGGRAEAARKGVEQGCVGEGCVAVAWAMQPSVPGPAGMVAATRHVVGLRAVQSLGWGCQWLLRG